jgi:hypothetical protein
MSTTAPVDPQRFISKVLPRYAKSTGPDRYARFIEEILELERTFPQDRILRALDEHKQVVVVAANGLGKSYIAAAGGVAALHCNPDTIVNVTAGTSTTLKTNIWKPARSIYRESILPDVLGGRTMDGDREIRTGLDEKWFLECVSPAYPDDLEGPHNDHVIFIVEEADKPGVTAEHIESVRSTATDDNDRALVIANPPRDENNIVYDLMESDQWHTLRFATWDSHNVRVDRALEDREKIGGIADTSKLVDDWHEYHGEDWPGLERAIEISSPYLTPDSAPTVDPRRADTDADGDPVENDAFRTDLDERWYRRRAGIMPPGDSRTHRPVHVADVNAAYDRQLGQVRETPSSVGIDVARSSDLTVMAGVHGQEIRIHYAEQGTDHEAQKREIEQGADSTPALGEWPNPRVAVDKGYAPGFFDYLNDRVPNVEPFQNGTLPIEPTRFKDKWTEALFHFGQFLREGGSIADDTLRTQAVVAAREIEFSERTLMSRGENGAEVLEATSKDAVKGALDAGSPDYLDAALMAVWAERTDEQTDGRATTATISW